MISESPDDVESVPPAGRGGRRLLLWIAVAAVAIAGLVFFAFTPKNTPGADKTAPGMAGGDPKGDKSARPVPVLTAVARTQDVGVYATGLGTVTPLNTVAVKSRVDGQILRIAFQEGQNVKAGDLLAELDPRPFQVQLMQAEGQKAKDEAGLANAKVDLGRYQVLIQEDSIPRQQLDTQNATIAQLQAALQSDQASIESAKLNLTYSRITAPAAGRVGLRQVDVGNIVHANDPTGMVTITQLAPIAVVFNLPADRLPDILPKLRAGRKLVVEAFDRDLKHKLATGELLAVDNQIDPTTGTVRLKAVFANREESLFANQFVNARLLVETLKDAVTVPTAALQRSPQATFVYVVQTDQTVAAKNVVVQLSEGEQATLKSGLAAGDVVVVDGIDKLKPGAKVDATRADAVGGPNAHKAAGR